jgi:plasmid maintenance system antidote protein VapI
MENILLQALQEIRKHTPETIAEHLGISVAEYMKIETGKTLLTEEQAGQLGKLFKVKSKYIYKAALQLELLLIRNEMLKMQNLKIEELEKRVKELERMKR